MTKITREIQILREKFLCSSDDLVNSIMDLSLLVPYIKSEDIDELIKLTETYEQKRVAFFSALTEYDADDCQASHRHSDGVMCAETEKGITPKFVEDKFLVKSTDTNYEGF